MSPSDEFKQNYMTEAEVSEVLGYTLHSLQCYRSAKNWKRIPSGWVKLGKSWYLPRKEWTSWLTSRKRTA